MADDGGVEAPKRFKIVVRPFGIIGGILLGLGIPILLQQYAVTPLTTGLLITWLIIGIVAGVVVPTLVRLVVGPRTPKPEKGAT